MESIPRYEGSENGTAMIDVFNEVSLSDGTPSKDAMNLKEIITQRIHNDEELMNDLGFDEM